MNRFMIILMLICLAVCMAGCSATHNLHGGYRDACGELPGLIGDDC